MKKLFSFKIPREIEVEIPEESKDAEGNSIKIIKKVKETKYDDYFLAKPTRSLLESGQIFYAAKVSEYIKAGILSVNLIQRRTIDDGGALTQEQRKGYESLFNSLFEKQSKHRLLLAKLEPTEEDKTETNKVFNEIIDTLTSLQNIEKQVGNNLYQNTAETIAQNRTAVWWMINISYKEENGKEIPVFSGKNYEEKLSSYDNLEESGDEYNLKLLNKLYLYTSMWYMSGAKEQVDFEVMEKMAENQGILNLASEELPTEPSKEKQQELELK